MAFPISNKVSLSSFHFALVVFVAVGVSVAGEKKR